MSLLKQTVYLFALVLAFATMLFAVSCKKIDPVATTPWHKKSVGIDTPQRGVVEMSTYNQTTCYGIFFNTSPNFSIPHDITVTHNDGATWRTYTIAELENNYTSLESPQRVKTPFM